MFWSTDHPGRHVGAVVCTVPSHEGCGFDSHPWLSVEFSVVCRPPSTLSVTHYCSGFDVAVQPHWWMFTCQSLFCSTSCQAPVTQHYLCLNFFFPSANSFYWACMDFLFLRSTVLIFSHIADWGIACLAVYHKKNVKFNLWNQDLILHLVVKLMCHIYQWGGERSFIRVLELIPTKLCHLKPNHQCRLYLWSPETWPRHLFVCTSGNAVSLLDHLAWLCFNSGWTLHHRPGLSTLIHFLIYFNRHERSYRMLLLCGM